jgi:hypothetical protein
MMRQFVAVAVIAVLAPSASRAMSWCTERQLMFDSAEMCSANCPAPCTEAVANPQGGSGSCTPAYRGYVYSPALNRTYALSVAAPGLDELPSSPDFAARGILIKSQGQNTVAAMLTSFYDTRAWIAASAAATRHCSATGAYFPDEASCVSGCPGGTCSPLANTAAYNSPLAERFFWRDGTTLAYRNFAAGQPDNQAGVDDLQAAFTPRGEHWLEMAPDGRWHDAGKHVADTVHAQPVMVEFTGALECVNGAAPVDTASAWACSRDVNGDGQVGAGEVAPCVETGGGRLCPLGAVECTSADSCPLGNFPCVEYGGRVLCSAHACTETGDSEAEQASYQDDGNRDQSSGRCTGQVYIFNGKPGECKEPGMSTTWFQCCSTNESSFLFIEKVCGTGDRNTAAARRAERTHYVGRYCKRRLPFIGCVQRAQVHCVFGSKLGRIIQEQGRMQLRAFQDARGNPSWGTPRRPNCRGFTPEEFQFLDFAKMDLSEFFTDIRTRAADSIQGEIGDVVDDYYSTTTP